MAVSPDQICDFFRVNMRARRLELGMTQDQVGKLIGQSASAVSFIESGERSPELRTMAKIAVALKTTLGALTSAESFSTVAS